MREREFGDLGICGFGDLGKFGYLRIWVFGKFGYLRIWVFDRMIAESLNPKFPNSQIPKFSPFGIRVFE